MEFTDMTIQTIDRIYAVFILAVALSITALLSGCVSPALQTHARVAQDPKSPYVSCPGSRIAYRCTEGSAQMDVRRGNTIQRTAERRSTR
jgi:hypothetical protein